MSIRYRFLTIVCCMTLILSQAIRARSQFVDDFSKAPDLYERIDILWDSLVTLNKAGLREIYLDTIIDDTTVGAILDDYPCSIEARANGDRLLKIELPIHEVFRNNRLWIDLHKNKVAGGYKARLIAKQDSGFVALIDTILEKSRLPSSRKELVDLIGGRIAFYRAIPLPPPFWYIDSNGAAQASFVLHGRDVDTLSYRTSKRLFGSLHTMCAGLWSYVGVEKIAVDSTAIEIRLIMLVTFEGAGRNHFFDILERHSMTGAGAFHLVDVIIDAFPFVRTNNVLNLLSGPRQSRDSSQIDVRLRR